MINISHILSQIFNGIQFGVAMALLATGLSLIFGMIGVMNFVHDSLYMSGPTWSGHRSSFLTSLKAITSMNNF